MNNYLISIEETTIHNSLIIPTYAEKIIADNEMFNYEDFTILHLSPPLNQLQQIKLGYLCFKHVREFVIDGLPRLENIATGLGCFNSLCFKNDYVIIPPQFEGVIAFSDIEFWEKDGFERYCEYNGEGLCKITNCPNLRNVKFDSSNFRFFSIFDLSDLKSLQSVAFGESCFYYSKYFSLQGLCLESERCYFSRSRPSFPRSSVIRKRIIYSLSLCQI